jgi:hypothetical protein
MRYLLRLSPTQGVQVDEKDGGNSYIGDKICNHF